MSGTPERRVRALEPRYGPALGSAEQERILRATARVRGIAEGELRAEVQRLMTEGRHRRSPMASAAELASRRGVTVDQVLAEAEALAQAAP